MSLRLEVVLLCGRRRNGCPHRGVTGELKRREENAVTHRSVGKIVNVERNWFCGRQSRSNRPWKKFAKLSQGKYVTSLRSLYNFSFFGYVDSLVCTVNINEVPISSIKFKKSANQRTHMLRGIICRLS
jgi:hypothetical protein